MQKFVIITGLLLTSLCLKSQSQLSEFENHYRPRPFYSFNIGLSVISQNLTEQTIYRPITFLFHRSIPVTKRNTKQSFAVFYEPQFNPVIIDEKLKIDFGINLGLSYHLKWNPNFSSFISLGSGPHFINTNTDRQASGFIFSDNLAFGFIKKLPTARSNFDLSVQYRQRHISNAGLETPNRGINNGFLIVGLTKELWNSKTVESISANP